MPGACCASLVVQRNYLHVCGIFSGLQFRKLLKNVSGYQFGSLKANAYFPGKHLEVKDHDGATKLHCSRARNFMLFTAAVPGWT